MKKIKITVEFNQFGHGYINVTPSDYEEWTPQESSSNSYELEPGTYVITYETVTGGGGKITIEDVDTGEELASATLKAGKDKGSFRIKL